MTLCVKVEDDKRYKFIPYTIKIEITCERAEKDLHECLDAWDTGKRNFKTCNAVTAIRDAIYKTRSDK